MASNSYESKGGEQQSSPRENNDAEDVLGGGATTPTRMAQARPTSCNTPTRAAPARRASPQDSRFSKGEVMGDPPMNSGGASGGESGSEAGPHEEIGTDGAESGEEYQEATPEQLSAAESGEESAVSADLRSIEGFEDQESGEEGYSAPVQPLLLDAGAGSEGGQEEFVPILAALIPTLVSTIGPLVAKGVMSRLSPRAKRVIKRLPIPPRPSGGSVGTVLGSLGAAAKVIGRGTSGPSGLLALLAKLLESAQKAPSGPAGESASESTNALIEEAVAAMEVIIGTDDRIRITQTNLIPWRRICALRITFPSGATYRGTGFLIGPRTVCTAGHCVYLHNQGGWARSVEVIPGCNGTSRPYGSATSSSFRSVTGWVTNRRPASDYGCVVLPSGAFSGRALGSFGFAAFQAPILLAQPAVLAGYPGDKTFAEMWGMARKIKAVASATIVYDIDTVGGQSGAPVYIMRNGVRYVVGIHNYGASTGNSATRITQAVYERMLAWSNI